MGEEQREASEALSKPVAPPLSPGRPRGRVGAIRKPRWTPRDDERLRFFWSTPATVAELCQKLGRSPQGVCRRARQLGLQQRVPPGYEFFTHSAKRTGFDARTLRRILQWAGVPLHAVRSYEMRRRPRQRRQKAPFRQVYVEPFDVDVAVERWLRTETPGEAGGRIGVDGRTVRGWLRAAGVEGEPDRRRQWRVDSEILERVVREHHRPRH